MTTPALFQHLHLPSIMASTFDIPNARSKFPALNQKQVFFDNAGGSQVLGDVIKSYAKEQAKRDRTRLIVL